MKKRNGCFLVAMVLWMGIGSVTGWTAEPDQPMFQDIRLEDWHAGYVLTLAEQDLFRGYSDQTFRPGKSITRAEFLALVMKTDHQPAPVEEKTHWAEGYIKKAHQQGILTTKEELQQDWDQPISRAEAAWLLVRSQNPAESKIDGQFSEKPADWEQISDSKKAYVQKAFEKGWMSGYPDETFRPDHELTRAEASVVMIKTLGEDVAETVRQKIEQAKARQEKKDQEAEALRHQILETALELEGAPYQYGGSTPSGFDCSGYVSYIFARQGIELPRSSAAIYRSAETLSMEKVKPGDLVFFRGYQTGPSHVGIYTGDNEFIHAPSSGRTVSHDQIDDSNYWGQRFYGAARINE